MESLAILENGINEKEVTVKSTELVDIINMFREQEIGITGKEGKLTRPLVHKNFMAKIRKEIKAMENMGISGERNFKPSSYINNQNKEQPCFELTKEGALQMLNSESTFCRYKTIEYINKLEKDNKQLEQDNKELYDTAVSDKDLADRQYQADRVHYAINNIEKRLLECDYTNIVATVDKIVDVHTNLYVKDRYKPHQDTDKYGGKGSSLYVNHVKGIIEGKLDKIRPQMTLRDSNINSIILSKARQLHKEIESSKNITDGKIKSNLEKENKQLLTVIDSSIIYPRQSEFVVLDCHGFSENYQYTNVGDNIVKTDAYKNWIRYFPREDVPELEYWDDVDFTKPIELFINHVSKPGFDVKNLDKSFIDMIFNKIYKVDDNIVQAVHSQRVGTCNWFEDGKIGFYIRNL